MRTVLEQLYPVGINTREDHLVLLTLPNVGGHYGPPGLDTAGIQILKKKLG